MTKIVNQSSNCASLHTIYNLHHGLPYRPFQVSLAAKIVVAIAHRVGALDFCRALGGHHGVTCGRSIHLHFVLTQIHHYGMSLEARMDQWEQVRDELRSLRGKNLWRGVEQHLLPQLQVRLQGEWRGEGKRRLEAIICLGETEADIRVSVYPTGECLQINGDHPTLKALVRGVVEKMGGGNYLHTNSKSASYRKTATSREK